MNACFINVSKASDTVDPYLLFNKLLDRDMHTSAVRFLLKVTGTWS